jgi:hypothetical protein
MSEENHGKKFTKSAIEWRRSQVLSKLVLGWNQARIARFMDLHPSTISLDIQFLKEQSKKELETHVSDRLPYIHYKAMEGLDDVLMKTSDIEEKAEDNKTKLDCLRLRTELYKTLVLLGSDGGFAERAMKMVKIISPLPGEDLPVPAQSEDEKEVSKQEEEETEESEAEEDQTEE